MAVVVYQSKNVLDLQFRVMQRFDIEVLQTEVS
jgi:hypothetical protein